MEPPFAQLRSIQAEFIQTSVRKVNFRKKVLLYALSFLTVVPPILLFLFTLSNTISTGREGMSAERYANKVMISYWGSIGMLLFLALLFVPLIVVFNRSFNRRLAILPTLSSLDIVRALSLHQRLNALEKYMPAYIIRGEELILFKILKMEVVPMRAIRKIEVRNVRHKGGSTDKIRLTTAQDIVKFQLNGHSAQLNDLIKELLEIQPKLEIVRTTGWF